MATATFSSAKARVFERLSTKMAAFGRLMQKKLLFPDEIEVLEKLGSLRQNLGGGEK